MRALCSLGLICIWGCFCCSAAGAAWQAVVPEDAVKLPMLVAVDKSEQSARFYGERATQLERAKVPCSSGQVLGDKQKEGDKKTPEGVYFVESRKTQGLNYQLYGREAYTLNYPNPVDRLHNKTGHGIWIHGRGTPIVPRETKGCVALNNNDIAELDTKVTPDTPVILANTIAPYFIVGSGASAVKEKTRAWLRAWQERSDAFLQFYDPEAYSKSMRESFARFSNNKKRLFKRLPWIITWTDSIQVLEGPDYLVTWFNQYYRAKNLTVQGVRRLYWQKDSMGEYRIVGAEWKEKELGAEQAYLDAVAPSVHNFLGEWTQAWRNASVSKYDTFYAERAVQGHRKGRAAIRAHKRSLWQKKQPKQIVLSNVAMRMTRRGLEVSMNQYYGDTTGYADQGRKTLVLLPDGDSWVIVREEWRS